MKTSTSIFVTVFVVLIFQNSSIKAQWAQASETFRRDIDTISKQKYNTDTSLNLGHTIASRQEKLRIGFRSEFGLANIPKFQFTIGFDIGIGNLVFQADYRSYGGDSRQNNTPATPWDILLGGWAFNGKAFSIPIADLPNTLDGINEYSLTAGKVYSCLQGTIILMPSIGLAAVSRNIAHYHNCEQITQPGQDIILLFPAGEDDKSWYQYTTTVESQVSITIPLSLHMLVKFSSWIGLSISGWTEIGDGGSSGVSAGLELGILP